jgi:hypothetical protein
MNRCIPIARLTRWALPALIVLSGHASAQSLVLLEGAWELTLDKVTFPGIAAGSLIFSRCDSCRPEAARVTADTTYSTSQGRVILREFEQRVTEARAATALEGIVPVTVYYSLESGEVTRVALHDDDLSEGP